MSSTVSNTSRDLSSSMDREINLMFSAEAQDPVGFLDSLLQVRPILDAGGQKHRSKGRQAAGRASCSERGRGSARRGTARHAGQRGQQAAVVDSQQDERRCALLHAASQAPARSMVHGARRLLMLQTRRGRGRVGEEKSIESCTAIRSKSDKGLVREHGAAHGPQPLKQDVNARIVPMKPLSLAPGCTSSASSVKPPPRPRATCNGPTPCCRARAPARRPPSSQASTPAALSSSAGGRPRVWGTWVG
jgi:hypothetical protein